MKYLPMILDPWSITGIRHQQAISSNIKQNLPRAQLSTRRRKTKAKQSSAAASGALLEINKNSEPRNVLILLGVWPGSGSGCCGHIGHIRDITYHHQSAKIVSQTGKTSNRARHCNRSTGHNALNPRHKWRHACIMQMKMMMSKFSTKLPLLRKLINVWRISKV